MTTPPRDRETPPVLGAADAPDDIAPQATGPIASGLVLRSLLVLQLRATGGPMTVRDLCDRLQQLGVRTRTRASKDVSDALRWEVGRGRVHRVGRGTYRLGHLARSTAWRMRQRAQALTARGERCRSEAER